MNRVFFSSVGFGATGGGVFRPGHRHHGGGQGAHEEAGRLQVVPGGRRPGARRHGRPQERSQPVRPAVPHAGLRRPLNPREKPFSFLFFFSSRFCRLSQFFRDDILGVTIRLFAVALVPRLLKIISQQLAIQLNARQSFNDRLWRLGAPLDST